MIRVLGLLMGLAGPAAADTARVLTGEHADFTRLVIELPSPGAWQLGRTAMGYAFRVEAAIQPDYDLATVWTRIPRTRMQSLRADPDTGALFVGLGCDCHVVAFDYRPGTVVLDIRAGTAPANSPFESLLDLASEPVPEAWPEPVAYDWRDPDLAPGPQPDLPLVTGGISLAPLKEALLAQIARGAVDGVVDMALPGKPTLPDDMDFPGPDWARVGLGTLPGLVIGGQPATGIVAEAACLPDTGLALADWGRGRPALDILAEARNGLFGEFDAVSTEAALRAVRLHLYLGFGAEAQQYARLVAPEDRSDEMTALMSIAHLVEGEPDPAAVFEGMLACDGAAALWAALSRSELGPGSSTNTDAIVQSFLALPPHLRRHLGPRLTALILPRDGDAARMIRDAMARTPDMPGAEVALADARADLQAGRSDSARDNAETAMAAGYRGSDAFVALVDAHLNDLTPLPPDRAEALVALLQDASRDPDDPHLQRAVTLALALSGREDQALATAAAKRPEVSGDLWRAVAALADDNRFLSLAVAGPPPAIPTDVGTAVAARLISLGFPDAGLAWLGPSRLTDPPERRLLAARGELSRGNADAALSVLTGLSTAEAAGLRHEARIQLGALDPALLAAEAAGATEEANRLSRWRNDWPRLASADDPTWSAAANAALPSPTRPDGPLARGAATLAASAAAREAVAALLAAVPAPDL